jgi:Universal stress protein family
MRRELVLRERSPHWRQIAVAIDDSAHSLMTLHDVAESARYARARLTIIFIAPAPWPFVGLAGVSSRQLRADAIAEGARNLRRLTARLPADVPCTTLIRCGSATAEILKVLREDRHDALIVTLGHSGLLRRAAVRWVTAWRSRRTTVEVVVLRPSARAPRLDRRSAAAAVPGHLVGVDSQPADALLN